jgi:hypothetical protein
MGCFNGPVRTYIHASHAALAGKLPVRPSPDHFYGTCGTPFFAEVATGTLQRCYESFGKHIPAKEIVSKGDGHNNKIPWQVAKKWEVKLITGKQPLAEIVDLSIPPLIN